jgi:hypothetical protein
MRVDVPAAGLGRHVEVATVVGGVGSTRWELLLHAAKTAASAITVRRALHVTRTECPIGLATASADRSYGAADRGYARGRYRCGRPMRTSTPGE